MIDKATTLPDFNPSGDERVTLIKARVEEMIAYLRDYGGDPRCTSLAITNFEQGAMWAVKSLFVK